LESTPSTSNASRDVHATTSEQTWQDLCDELAQIQHDIALLLTSVYSRAAATCQRRQSASPTAVKLAKLERAGMRREMIELAMQVYLDATDSSRVRPQAIPMS